MQYGYSRFLPSSDPVVFGDLGLPYPGDDKRLYVNTFKPDMFLDDLFFRFGVFYGHRILAHLVSRIQWT